MILNGLSNADPAQSERNRNKIIVTMVNLEYETNKQFYGGQRHDGGQISYNNPAVNFNIDILISANFDDYVEALKRLTLVIEFFQANLTLDSEQYPHWPAGLHALKFEIENSPFSKTHNLWTALGVSYLPSIIYKIRHVTVQSGQIKATSAAIQDVSGAARQ